MPKRPCLDCGRPTSGSRCRIHAAQRDRLHHNRAYDSPAYRNLRTEVLVAWRSEHGDWCPGDGDHAGHRSTDLTLDHRLALVRGGGLLDPGNLGVLCRSANSAKGAR